MAEHRHLAAALDGAGWRELHARPAELFTGAGSRTGPARLRADRGPPQGQPPVAVLAHSPPGRKPCRPRVRHERQAPVSGPIVFADLVVFLDEVAGEEYTSDAEIFAGTPAQLADWLIDWGAPGSGCGPGRSHPELHRFPGGGCAALGDCVQSDACDGFILLPGGLDGFADKIVPPLHERGVFRTDYTGTTLRDHLGVGVPR